MCCPLRCEWRAEVNTGRVFPPSLSTLVFETGSLPEPGVHQSAGLTKQEALGSACLCSCTPVLRFQTPHLAFTWVSGTELRFLCLCGKCIPLWAFDTGFQDGLQLFVVSFLSLSSAGVTGMCTLPGLIFMFFCVCVFFFFKFLMYMCERLSERPMCAGALRGF